MNDIIETFKNAKISKYGQFNNWPAEDQNFYHQLSNSTLVAIPHIVLVKLKEAAIQGHNLHWDNQGTYGANCPECQRASKLLAEARQISEAHNVKF